MAQMKGQENERYNEYFRDQHGRLYIATCELATGDPVSMAPDDWTAPRQPQWARGLLIPPIDDHQICVVIPRTERARRGHSVFVNYDRWLEKLDARLRSWREHLFSIARNQYPGLRVDPDAPPPDLLEYVGGIPWPPRDFVAAMRAGNPWALGQSDVVPGRALEMLTALKSHIMRSRQVGRDDEADEVVTDPLAEPLGAESADPDFEKLDAFEDLSEQHDPFAEGGTTQKVGQRRRRGSP